MEEPLILTKSDFQLYLEAPLHLWGAKHGCIKRIPTEFEIHIMNQGYVVERYAKEYLEKYIVNTKEGESIEFQKTFSDGHFLARTDALVYKPKTKTYDIYEIKSSSGVKPDAILDGAFQYLIANKHIQIDRIFILHLDKDYVRLEFLNLDGLFIAENITEKVQDCLMDVDVKRGEALEVAIVNISDGIQHCYKPKDCPCPKLCHPSLPGYSIYDIPRITKKKKVQLLEQGIQDIKDVPQKFPLNDKQRKIVNVAKKNKEFIDREAIRKEFEHFEYPLYFLDYETFLSAIPLFDGYHSQQQMVFQYSLHGLDSLNGEVTHSEHLSITKEDPSLPLIEKLSKDIGNTGTVFVWNKAFEIGRNRELAVIHPDYADFLNNLNDRIYDLGDFINYGLYIHPDFKGSWSIKNVLPIMVPELCYSELEICKGDQAMMAWSKLINGDLPMEDVKKTELALLEYCKLDTYAMVAIFLKLSEFL